MDQRKLRKRTRLAQYDYSTDGYYYVTICTDNRKYIFGDIVSDEMVLTRQGEIAKTTWIELSSHHVGVELDAFVVMPNHIHGIIIINSPVGAGPARPVNLSVVVGSYKSSVARQINRIQRERFRWQRSFYDTIIRTPQSLENIQNYIANNPATWGADENNINHLSVKGQAGQAPTDV